MSVPALRFKQDDGKDFPDWGNTTLEDVSINYYQGINTAADKVEYIDGGVPIIQAKHITGEYLDFSYARGLSQSDYDKYKKKYNPKVNDLLISNIGTLGKVVLVDAEINFLVAWNIFKVTLNTDRCYPQFIRDFLKKIASDGYFDSIKTGNATKFINKSDMLAIEIVFPCLREQTKIANFLTAVDEKISQLTQKHDLLNQYKKGVMQQIFSHKLRFTEYQDSGLRTGNLKDFGYFYYGKSAPKSSVTSDAKTPCIRYGELYSTYKGHIKEIKSKTNIDPKELKFSKGGEVLIPRVGEDPLDFANCSYLPFGNVAIGEMISVYNTKEYGLYLTYYINTMLKKQFAKFVEGGSVSNLYFSYLEDIEITIPSIEEQTKIANFLAAIDNKLTATQTQLQAVKQYKQGLLQQMFV